MKKGKIFLDKEKNAFPLYLFYYYKRATIVGQKSDVASSFFLVKQHFPPSRRQTASASLISQTVGI
ncbi:MAG: hypothetical protein J6Y84_07710 [Bacteroidaceae bacterium]|nr:hypothetical protein [Bacteroidaceae bacterium]